MLNSLKHMHFISDSRKRLIFGVALRVPVPSTTLPIVMVVADAAVITKDLLLRLAKPTSPNLTTSPTAAVLAAVTSTPAGLPVAAGTTAIAVGVMSFAAVALTGVRHIRTFWVFFAAMEILLKIKIGTHNQ